MGPGALAPRTKKAFSLTVADIQILSYTYIMVYYDTLYYNILYYGGVYEILLYHGRLYYIMFLYIVDSEWTVVAHGGVFGASGVCGLNEVIWHLLPLSKGLRCTSSLNGIRRIHVAATVFGGLYWDPPIAFSISF